MIRDRSRFAPMLVVLAVAGCAANAVYVGRFDPGQFGAPSAPAVTPDPARVAVGVEPAELDRMQVGGPTMRQRLQINLPLGRIVEGAARVSFAREFDLAVPGQPQPDPPLRVEIGGIRFEIRDDLPSEQGSAVLPLYDLTGRMTFEVRVVDANGTERWAGDYDAGREVWVPPPAAPALPRRFEPGAWDIGLQKMAHEQALKLTGQAARDVRAWLQSERLRERSL